VLCVPQWQGSRLGDSPRLAAGARRTAELVSADAQVRVPVHDTGGKPDAGVRSLAVLVENLRRTQETLAGIGDVVVTSGSDCGMDPAPIAAARARYGDRLTVLWIDAHPDLYTPRTLRSGSFHGMVLRTLLGDEPAALVPAHALTPEQVIMGGTGGRYDGTRLRRAGRHPAVWRRRHPIDPGDEKWALGEPLLPPAHSGGRQRRPRRAIVGPLRPWRAPAAWRQSLADSPPWRTA
jgi:arginase